MIPQTDIFCRGTIETHSKFKNWRVCVKHMSYVICWKIQTSQNLPNIFERLQRIYIFFPCDSDFTDEFPAGRWQFAHLCLETVLWKDLRDYRMEKDGKGHSKAIFSINVRCVWFLSFELLMFRSGWGSHRLGIFWASMRRRRDKIDVTCSASWKIRPFGDVFYFP